MARARRVRGIRPDGRLRANARRILAVRIAEMHERDAAVRDPDNVTDLHDMRIACKRVRYLLESFRDAFEVDLGPFLTEIRDLQETLGDIHDCDVQVPLLERHLIALAVADATGDGPERDAAQAGGVRPADERPGVVALIALRRRRRIERYDDFLGTWDRLAAEGFRPRLEEALGIRRA